jgi:glutaminyl-peptide cyclotransferase
VKKLTFPLIFLLFVSLLGGGIFLWHANHSKPGSSGDQTFDALKAMDYLQYQLELGPRIMGSAAHAAEAKWIQQQLSASDWDVSFQQGSIENHSIENIIAKRDEGSHWVILGAHYDSRIWADNDPDLSFRLTPVPGANDGASGVAILLELARSLPKIPDTKVWIVLFDAEDNGGIQNWDWILGSKFFVSQLIGEPDQVIVIDMVGDSDLNIYQEMNSDKGITESVWAQADELGYANEFIAEEKYSMIDDHTPFLEAGIPAIDIIDFDYPYWHTTQDTVDKVSMESLKAVGETLWNWLVNDNHPSG